MYDGQEGGAVVAGAAVVGDGDVGAGPTAVGGVVVVDVDAGCGVPRRSIVAATILASASSARRSKMR